MQCYSTRTVTFSHTELTQKWRFNINSDASKLLNCINISEIYYELRNLLLMNIRITRQSNNKNNKMIRQCITFTIKIQDVMYNPPPPHFFFTDVK